MNGTDYEDGFPEESDLYEEAESGDDSEDPDEPREARIEDFLVEDDETPQ